MSVSRADVLHVAKLARLPLSEDEVSLFTEQLNSILAHVQELQVVDVTAVEAVVGAAQWPAPLRDDLPGADPLVRSVVQLSPHQEAGFFSVPRLPALDSDAS
ncbi:MAG: Asp-tRNA(Asn)/Glu-tRNA(Gln) amidotransferase subunit GatC [Longimicrobiales bacterium]